MPNMQNYLNRRPVPEPRPVLLPLAHTTRSSTLRDEIVIKRQLRANKESEDFPGEKLVFLFYGCAGFESEQNLNTKFKIDDRPTTLLYQYKSIEAVAQRLLPYDSGGSNYYEKTLGSRIDHTDFTIERPRQETYQQLTALLYGDSQKYMKSTLLKNVYSIWECPAFQTLGTLHKALHDTTVTVEYDKRAFLFEAQYLDEDNLVANPECIFVPNEIKKTPEYEEYLKEKFNDRIKVISYHDKVNDKLRDCYTKMQSTVERYVINFYLKPPAGENKCID